MDRSKQQTAPDQAEAVEIAALQFLRDFFAGQRRLTATVRLGNGESITVAIGCEPPKG